MVALSLLRGLPFCRDVCRVPGTAMLAVAGSLQLGTCHEVHDDSARMAAADAFGIFFFTAAGADIIFIILKVNMESSGITTLDADVTLVAVVSPTTFFFPCFFFFAFIQSLVFQPAVNLCDLAVGT